LSNKQRQQYSCTNCSHVSVKWLGRCPACEEWNSFSEKKLQQGFAGKAIKFGARVADVSLKTLNQIDITEQRRMLAGIKEWDRVLGGGIFPGSFLILTGDPGIGKSTLLLQVAQNIAQHARVLYFSTEESLQQIKSRALRLEISSQNLLFSDIPDLESIIAAGIKHKPDLLIIDSIQNCHLSSDTQAIPGTVTQLREAGFHLMRLAKENNIAVLVTGHVTKEGTIAGPRVLEHMVDGVFYLQAEDRWQMRMLRSVKNRFGPINEVGFFNMQEHGLVEVVNINQQLLNEVTASAGSALVCCVEGSRPILLELQALVIPSKFGIAQRVATGIDQKQVVLIAAILEKYLRINFSAQDIFFKVSGGLRIKESSSDLGVALALLSSYFQKPLMQKSVALAEISLTGQIKPTNQFDLCMKEVEKFGFKTTLLAAHQKTISGLQLLKFHNVYELLRLFPEGE